MALHLFGTPAKDPPLRGTPRCTGNTPLPPRVPIDRRAPARPSSVVPGVALSILCVVAGFGIRNRDWVQEQYESWKRSAPATAAATNSATPAPPAAVVPLPWPAPDPQLPLIPAASPLAIAELAPKLKPREAVYIGIRTAKQTRSGVVALLPGDVVTLRERLADGRIRVVTDDDAEFTVMPAQLTTDPAVARKAAADYVNALHAGR